MSEIQPVGDIDCTESDGFSILPQTLQKLPVALCDTAYQLPGAAEFEVACYHGMLVCRHRILAANQPIIIIFADDGPVVVVFYRGDGNQIVSVRQWVNQRIAEKNV